MSIGKEKMPTPPNIISNIQPKNESIAIMYTASEVYKFKTLSV
jgi:hypothetical protein